jgi:hypothetical protein
MELEKLNNKYMIDKDAIKIKYIEEIEKLNKK